MSQRRIIPLQPSVIHSFQTLKNNLKDATLITIGPDKEFKAKTDARHYCIVATLNQERRPVKFFSRTLNPKKIKHHFVDKEAIVIVEALRK